MSKLLLLLFLVSVPNICFAYGFTLLVEHSVYQKFHEVSFGYSSLFRHGRDNFHWLDLAYSRSDYILASELGRSQGFTTSYKYARRIRLARHFKPAVFTNLSLNYRRLSHRQSISNNQILPGSRPDIDRLGIQVGAGAGYIWEVKRFLFGFAAWYNYDLGFNEHLYKTSVFFSYEI